uniref:ATP synthase F0 subunit 8 n=1 Tax=Palaemon annandalei TaxID=392226 RepID=A0A344KVK2_9EUCA|nr:ATP synthase F0 subunit 8 [Palaemon annandalei]AXB37201.1 ATP synthase F0 subunit 8 [Palaemon annandalei]
MPQMAPLLWLNLYMFFTAVFAVIIILNFFMKPPIKISITPLSKMTTPKTWKW